MKVTISKPPRNPENDIVTLSLTRKEARTLAYVCGLNGTVSDAIQRLDSLDNSCTSELKDFLGRVWSALEPKVGDSIK